MLIIQDVLISDDIVRKNFVCNLNACKGACCWEGDFGAPVKEEEEEQIIQNLQVISTTLNSKSKARIEEGSIFSWFNNGKIRGIELHETGHCIFLTKDPDTKGFRCGIEMAHSKGISSVNKPISCHLYPIRVDKNEKTNFEAWNYDEWEICSPACTLGDELKVPIYQFLKEAIIRYKGEAFYEELHAAAQHLADKE